MGGVGTIRAQVDEGQILKKKSNNWLSFWKLCSSIEKRKSTREIRPQKLAPPIGEEVTHDVESKNVHPKHRITLPVKCF